MDTVIYKVPYPGTDGRATLKPQPGRAGEYSNANRGDTRS